MLTLQHRLRPLAISALPDSIEPDICRLAKTRRYGLLAAIRFVIPRFRIVGGNRVTGRVRVAPIRQDRHGRAPC